MARTTDGVSRYDEEGQSIFHRIRCDYDSKHIFYFSCGGVFGHALNHRSAEEAFGADVFLIAKVACLPPLRYDFQMLIHDPIAKHLRLAPTVESALAKMGLNTIADLLFHFPVRYIEGGGTRRIGDLIEGAHASVYGEVTSAETKKTFRSRMPAGELVIRDASGTLRAIWFRQPYIATMHKVGTYVRLDGVVKRAGKHLSMVNPHIEKVEALPGEAGTLFEGAKEGEMLYPVYPETRGVSSSWFFHAMEKIVRRIPESEFLDPITEEILSRYHLPKLKTALFWIHFPKNKQHAESARKRFAFQEIFFLQIGRQHERRSYLAHKAFRFGNALSQSEAFTKRLPFSLTGAQKRAIATIAEDVNKEKPMLRLLEGDVGSGKTAVAAAIAAAIVAERSAKDRFQVAYLCPTEVLAAQQFSSFIEHFRGDHRAIGLLTGSGCFKFPSKVDHTKATRISRAQLLKWVENGDIPILVGTHALIQKSVRFRRLAFVIIDEQHRFGTGQRAKLVQKGDVAPHVLSMTATPIPRTLALTMYGDLDLSLLDSMPPGRKPIQTKVIIPSGRKAAEEFIRKELLMGRQAYIICPRIDEPDPEKELALNAKSVKEEAKRLAEKIFPEFSIDILHSKLTPQAKAEVMDRFALGKTKILVSTSVVEVGVNVPNATIMVIEGAERFGLAQLHQLRGRVIRGTHQAHCFLFTESTGEKTRERLKALLEAKNGFELAERDLRLRGSGDLSGAKQWGISDIGMEAIRNQALVSAARDEANRLLDGDPSLSLHPNLRHLIDVKDQRVHLE